MTTTPPFGLTHDAHGRLVLIDAEGRRHVGVEPVRAFPISDPARFIAICDARGREVVSIGDLATLPAALRRILEHELAEREFLPIIRRIVAVSSDTTPAEWQVETDRGPTRFTLDDEDDIRRLGPHRILIADSEGVRYQVVDARDLDAASKRLLDRYL